MAAIILSDEVVTELGGLQAEQLEGLMAFGNFQFVEGAGAQVRLLTRSILVMLSDIGYQNAQISARSTEIRRQQSEIDAAIKRVATATEEVKAVIGLLPKV